MTPGPPLGVPDTSSHLAGQDGGGDHLNNAVYLVEDFLRSATNPPADAEVARPAPQEGQCLKPPGAWR